MYFVYYLVWAALLIPIKNIINILTIIKYKNYKRVVLYNFLFFFSSNSIKNIA